MRRILICFAFTSALTGCASVPSTTATPTPVATTAAAPATSIDDPLWPLQPDAYRTTSGAIYLGNLDARIDEYRRIIAARNMAVHHVALAGDLYHRYRVVGRIADAEDALALLDAAIAADPDAAQAYQLRGVVRAGFHRFDEALADLDAAQRHGAKATDLASTRREIQLALGDYAALKSEFERSTDVAPSLYELAHRADLRVMQGDLAGATFLYRAAQTQYRDVNPVPLAWLHLQQGIALLRFGKVAEAREFFAAAHARLPQYYLATEHLAECEAALGHHDRAREIYRDVITQTGNAEFVAALSGVERSAGNTAEADRLVREAEAGYEALLAKYPSAYAQHASEFFIEIGKPERAYALAQENLTVRQDVGSWILLATTADAAGQTAAACAARAKALATGMTPPEMADLKSLENRCS